MAFSYAEPELPVAQLVLSHILGSLNALHSVGLVHRDVKPLNLILSERDRAFKLIDLGACADLRTGRNFTPDETILDPKYSPPEEFLMPIDAAPDLAKASGPVAFALGAASWARYQPDRFDTYSAGIVFMQARPGRKPWWAFGSGVDSCLVRMIQTSSSESCYVMYAEAVARTETM